jgi:hypothetical protein
MAGVADPAAMVSMQVFVEGADAVIATLRGIQNRCIGPEPAAAAVFSLFEAQEANVFDQLHGVYVDTSRVRASLTEPAAEGAVRSVTPFEWVFGSDVWYGRFLTTVIGPPSGVPRGMKRNPPSAVLRIPLYTQVAAGQLILRYVARGEGGRFEGATASVGMGGAAYRPPA